MLAIMNIGKYSSSGIVPSGSDLFTISANQSLGQAIDFYARKGNTILGLPYMQNVIYRSTNGGASWETVSSPYYLAHIFYSSIEDKFYALELGDENVPQTLHYGYSTDGETWTWDTLLTNATAKTHYFGTFIEEVGGEVTFDFLKVDSTSVTKGGDKAYASHIRVYTNNTQQVIGSTYELTVTEASTGTSVSDFYPLFTTRHGKTKVALTFESWRAVGYQYNVSQRITVGAWGVEVEVAYQGSGYSEGRKCFDKFYNTGYSVSSGNITYRYDYSETTRVNTWVNYSNTLASANAYNKIFGFFQLGNYFYMAYQRYSNNTTVWYRAGDVNSLITVLAGDTFNKSDLTGVPVSEYTLDNKHFLLSMADGKIYLCEAT